MARAMLIWSLSTSTDCGADLQRDGIPSNAPSLAAAKVSIVHSIPELKVSTNVSANHCKIYGKGSA